jgi:hypothetical protein
VGFILRFNIYVPAQYSWKGEKKKTKKSISLCKQQSGPFLVPAFSEIYPYAISSMEEC